VKALLWRQFPTGVVFLISGTLFGFLIPSTASACSQVVDQPHALEIPIHRQAHGTGVGQVVRADFDLFFAAYSALLREQLRGATPTRWEYWVALMQEPRGGRLRIVVTGKAHNMEVKIGTFAPTGALKRVRGVVQRSVALWRDPYLGALASGDSAALEALLPGSRSK
jgi:hypothetical protein